MVLLAGRALLVFLLVLLVLLPLAGFSLATAIFWNRLPEELPVAVVEAEKTAEAAPVEDPELRLVV